MRLVQRSVRAYVISGVLLGAFSCTTGQGPSTSSSTSWATCEVEDDCHKWPEAVACEGGYCLDEDGDRIPVSNSSTGGSPSVGGQGGEPLASGGSSSDSGGASQVGGALQSGGSSTGGAMAGSGSGGDESSGGSLGSGGAEGVCAFVDTYNECSVTEDCTTGEYTKDCCGSRAVVGVHQDNIRQFVGDASVCDASYPACGCAGAEYPWADDGRNLGMDGVAGVRCDNGRCKTFVSERRCGDTTCVDGDLCVRYISTTGPTEVSEYACVPNTCGSTLDCTCGQAFCDLRTDRTRSCIAEAYNVGALQDFSCEDNFQ